jgi:hypothetical protein
LHNNVGSLTLWLLGDRRLGRNEPNMMIIGVDYHPSFQQIAFFVEETGERGEGQFLLDRMNPTIEELTAAAARAIAFAIEQPADTDVNKIIIRPTAQGW